MALLPEDRRGQMLAVFTLLAVTSLYFLYAGTPIGGVPGWKSLGKTRDSLQAKIDSLDKQVEAAQRVVRQGTVAQLERRLAEYRASLDLMRQLVPNGEEIPNLLDDISSRAKIRGAEVVSFQPSLLESGAPFDTKRVRFIVKGQYDQIGDFLADIASLQRVIVPYDVKIERVQGTVSDSARLRRGALLQASFQIRTYVKPASLDTVPAARSGR
jgi:type IV pilus assembly protein PilO